MKQKRIEKIMIINDKYIVKGVLDKEIIIITKKLNELVDTINSLTHKK